MWDTEAQQTTAAAADGSRSLGDLRRMARASAGPTSSSSRRCIRSGMPPLKTPMIVTLHGRHRRTTSAADFPKPARNVLGV